MDLEGEILEQKISAILGRTTYTREQALELLKQNDNDHKKVINGFKPLLKRSNLVATSVANSGAIPAQKIYTEMRKILDISEYHKQNPIDMQTVAESFRREDLKL